MSFLHSFSPIPSLSTYPGPYSVGTEDLEIPLSSLPPSTLQSAPDPAITTISFRIFYPCADSDQPQKKPVYWLPEPQDEHFQAYARFMQASPWLASLLRYFPLARSIYHTTIPCQPSASLLPPPSSPPKPTKHPLAIFSHGLGGTKNAYSSLLGSLASHGIIAIALDHRDGSAPISLIRTQPSTFNDAKRIPYRQLGHQGGAEWHSHRDHQLRVRCWELAAAHAALVKIDEGCEIMNLASPDPSDGTTTTSCLRSFANRLEIQKPGKIAFIGHSFGAATIVQFLKSVIHPSPATLLPSPSPDLRSQITPSTPTILLDLWAQPLLSPATTTLFDKPLPSYCDLNRDDPGSDSRRGGGRRTPPLAILSGAFKEWSGNLATTLQIIAPPTSSHTAAPTTNNDTYPAPHIFYTPTSAHLSQSDFGPLFPWLTRRMFGALEPDRTVRLNVRAILEVLDGAGVGVVEEGEKERILEGEEGGESRIWVRIPLPSSGGKGEGEGEGESEAEGIQEEEGEVEVEVDVEIDMAADEVDTKAEMGRAAEKERQRMGGSPDSGYDSPGHSHSPSSTIVG